MHIHIHTSRIHLSKRYRGLRRDSGGEHALLIEIEILKSQLYSHLIGYLLVVHWLLSICFTPGRQRGRLWCVYVKAFVSALWVYVLGGDSEEERDVCMCMHLWVHCECMYSGETARESVMCWPKQKVSKVQFIFIASSACSSELNFQNVLEETARENTFCESQWERSQKSVTTFPKVNKIVLESQWERCPTSFCHISVKRDVQALSFERAFENVSEIVLKSQQEREVGGWGRDPKKCTGRDWGMVSSTI